MGGLIRVLEPPPTADIVDQDCLVRCGPSPDILEKLPKPDPAFEH